MTTKAAGSYITNPSAANVVGCPEKFPTILLPPKIEMISSPV
jgi:hypothetical protein